MQTTISAEYVAERDARDARYFWVVLGPGDVGSKPVIAVCPTKADALYRLQKAPAGSYYSAVEKGMRNDFPGGIKTATDARRYASGNYKAVGAEVQAQRLVDFRHGNL